MWKVFTVNTQDVSYLSFSIELIMHKITLLYLTIASPIKCRGWYMVYSTRYLMRVHCYERFTKKGIGQEQK